jgi:hypothetical protein
MLSDEYDGRYRRVGWRKNSWEMSVDEGEMSLPSRLHLQTALRDLQPSTLQVNQQLSRTNRAKEQTHKKE